MSTDPNPAPAEVPPAIPWYRSAVFQGILVTFVAQALVRSKLASILTTDQGVALVNALLDAISAAALAYAAHGRVKKPLPAITLTKADAAKVAAASAPAVPPPPQSKEIPK